MGESERGERVAAVKKDDDEEEDFESGSFGILSQPHHLCVYMHIVSHAASFSLDLSEMANYKKLIFFSPSNQIEIARLNWPTLCAFIYLE
jgi:hypothetical protein